MSMNIFNKHSSDWARAPESNGSVAPARIHHRGCGGRPPGGLPWHRTGDVLGRSFKTNGLMRFLRGLLILAALGTTVPAGQGITLAWNRSADPIVAGYNIYYGGASGAYTNVINAGQATNATLSGLIPGITHYLAATTYSAAGLESPFSSEITYTIPLTAVATLWSGTAAPGVVDAGPDNAVELGVKFSSDVGGSVTGIRFYKASANTGTHVGNLWTSAGTLLATATFTSETASGWQQVNFATPVSITANTVYVVSYHATTGHYSFTDNYFSVNGVDNPPLHAPADGVSGGNGVYAYGASSAFPNLAWNARNYWVDPVVVWTTAFSRMQIRVTPAKQYVLTVTGTPGHTYDILATQDFKTWTVIGTVTLGSNGSSVFTDTNAAGFSRRFYRTRG
jgi:hypothetical protein